MQEHILSKRAQIILLDMIIVFIILYIAYFCPND